MSLQSQVEELMEEELAALKDENEQLRRTVKFHEDYGVNERQERAYGILVAMIQSQPPGYTNRNQVDAKMWARKAYEFADALASEGGKA